MVDSTSEKNRSNHPPFPEPGSIIKDKYFCLGRLGKGTFCAIHKCVDLSTHHTTLISTAENDDDTKQKQKQQQRIVAAKVELANFVDSGVIDGEASVLKFLDVSLPNGSMVPTYVDYVRQQPNAGGGGGAPSTAMDTTTTNNNTNNNNNMATPTPAEGGVSEKGGGPQSSDGGLSAIIMEYLPGEDMHLLRDRHCQSLLEKSTGGNSNSEEVVPAAVPGEKASRRLSVEDSVYLVADVMLPLLKAMHDVGMVHRDVKPSNVVRTGTDPSDKAFKIVDFGLSKSFVVPKDSSFANHDRPWTGKWMSPSFSNKVGADKDIDDSNLEACVRAERESAEFRGTSMYASLRVHQGKDHCPRDDIWGLLYVFCDLVSGGLPWMGYASARDRASCQIIKEMVMGERGRDDWEGTSAEEEKMKEEGNSKKPVEGMAMKPNPEKVPKDGEDAIEWLLYGAEYHNAKYRRDMKSQKGGSTEETDSQPALLEPLALSKNEHYITCLRKAFRHVASLGFVETPNYDLIGQCLRGFLKDLNPEQSVPSIDWKERQSTSSKRRRESITNKPTALDTGGVAWNLIDEEADPLDDNTLVEAEVDRQATLEAATDTDDTPRSVEQLDLARLPLQMQFAIAQVEYNARNPDTVPRHVALKDWMTLAVPLSHGAWDTTSWERGNHRTDDDGYRNEVYMSILQKCLDAADPFNRFSDRECFYHPLAEGETKPKRRRVGISIDAYDSVSESPLVVVSRVFFSMRLALDMQKGKNFAPPPKLSFGAFGR